jgi:hypothetical protein
MRFPKRSSYPGIAPATQWIETLLTIQQLITIDPRRSSLTPT